MNVTQSHDAVEILGRNNERASVDKAYQPLFVIQPSAGFPVPGDESLTDEVY